MSESSFPLLTDITREQKLAEVVREIALRRVFYRGQVKTGRMKQDEADRRIAIMEAIAEDLRLALRIYGSS